MNVDSIKKININFILCTGRTGSTLLSSMLNMHANIVSCSEETFAYNLHVKYKNIKAWTSKIIDNYCYDFYLFSEGKLEVQFGTQQDLKNILETYKESLNVELAIRLTYLCFFPNKNKNEVNTIVDKELVFHFIHKEIAEIYPKSKFIVLLRDPRDNALVRCRMAERGKKKVSYWFLALAWNYVYKTLYYKTKNIDKSRVIFVKYEDLVSNPENELRKICSFLEVPYSDEMLLYDDHIKKALKENNHTLSEVAKENIGLLHQGLTKKPTTDKIGFWKQNLPISVSNVIWTICGGLAEKLGYEKDSSEKTNAKSMERINAYLLFWYFYQCKPFLYYNSPFFLRKFVKKIKYSNRIKNGKWIMDGKYSKRFAKQ